MRPSAVTADASVITSAAPPTARDPRCTRCQSDANPSVLEYWHIGDTTTRWGSVRPRVTNGSKSEVILGVGSWKLGVEGPYDADASPCEVRTGSLPAAFSVVTEAA